LEAVLNTIAAQAGLERVLFTPAMKQHYFEMAVSAGGKTQFKHVDSIRDGVKYAADRANDKKRALLVCSVTDLVFAYDMLVRAVNDMQPIVIISVFDRVSPVLENHAAFTQFHAAGCLQFITHARQSLYDHLVLAYQLFEDHQVNLPVLIHQTTYNAPGELNSRDEINLGGSSDTFGPSKKTKGLDFDAALQSIHKKQEKKSVLSEYATINDTLNQCYKRMGFKSAETGFPFAGEAGSEDWAIVSLIPAQEEDKQHCIMQPMCYRPSLFGEIAEKLNDKKAVAVIEPKPAPGIKVPPFFAEFSTLLPLDCHALPVVTKHSVLTDMMIDKVDAMIQNMAGVPGRFPAVTELE